MGRSKINHYRISENGTQKQKIETTFKLLGLEGMLHSYEALAKEALEISATFYDFLDGLLEKERFWKEDNRIERWTRNAKFPFLATIEEFDFNWPTKIDKQRVLELASARFIEKNESVIFLGPPGLGKTHLSIALGHKAIYEGYDVKFLILNKLIEIVEKAIDNGTSMQRILSTYLRPRLLIVDEVDIHETQEKVSKFLFQLFYQRHKNGSTIFTSNKAFSNWSKIFGEETRAAMAMDRILGDATIITVEGDSYRIKDKLKKLEENQNDK